MKFIDSIIRFDMRIRVYKAFITINVMESSFWDMDACLLTSKGKDSLIRALNLLATAVALIDKGTDISTEITRDDIVEYWKRGIWILKRNKENMENIMDIVED